MPFTPMVRVKGLSLSTGKQAKKATPAYKGISSNFVWPVNTHTLSSTKLYLYIYSKGALHAQFTDPKSNALFSCMRISRSWRKRKKVSISRLPQTGCVKNGVTFYLVHITGATNKVTWYGLPLVADTSYTITNDLLSR